MRDDEGRAAGPAAHGPTGDGLAAHAAFSDLAEAAGEVMRQLCRELGFRLWALTRVSGSTYTVLTTGGEGYPAGPGEQFRWVDTLCHRVIDEGAPRIIPDVRAVPALRDAPLVRRWQIAAYLSVPLTVDGATLFGTLCALDREPRSPQVRSWLPLVDLQARLLSTVLADDLRLDTARRRAERAEADALLDPLTGLLNRRGWQLLLDREEQRCRRFGAVASVLVLDLDRLKATNDRHGHAAGDLLLQRTARVLRAATRSADLTARLGGDEFAVLAVETDQPAAARERDRLQHLLTTEGIAASVGIAARDPANGLTGAWLNADTDMYQVKRAKPPPPTQP
ncbi:MAG: hypothetical protein QOJ32_555 [Frankiaceae bacterium]|jgi:diguanylate cyclase (GGDEF)-like protein|nr:hypothetical protein [Frankiaceae bacterium]MDQ1647983.1 hypothetical protein [Frankiaceae bacterium]MDQ1674358.1 hypothetical protein [Frankiaceae bacterium]